MYDPFLAIHSRGSSLGRQPPITTGTDDSDSISLSQSCSSAHSEIQSNALMHSFSPSPNPSPRGSLGQNLGNNYSRVCSGEKMSATSHTTRNATSNGASGGGSGVLSQSALLDVQRQHGLATTTTSTSGHDDVLSESVGGADHRSLPDTSTITDSVADSVAGPNSYSVSSASGYASRLRQARALRGETRARTVKPFSGGSGMR